MSIKQSLPQVPWRRKVLLAMGFILLAVVCTMWAISVDSLKPLWLVILGLMAVLIRFYYFRPCPQCGHRMRFRQEPICPATYRHRILFYCKHCDIMWDSGRIEEENIG